MWTWLRTALAAIVILAWLQTGTALAQPWTSPDLTRRPAIIGHSVENFDLAISEVCFPYLLLNADESSWQEPHRTGILRYPRAQDAFAEYSTYFVGPRVLAGVRERSSARDCQVEALNGDPDALHTALLARMAQMPGEMKLAVTQIPARTFAHREFYCGPADGPQYAVLADYGPRADGGSGPPMIVTISSGVPRDARCDGGAAGQAEAPLTGLALRFQQAVSTCDAIIIGQAPDVAASASEMSLSAPVRAADSPLGANAQTGVVAFFGADARIRTYSQANANPAGAPDPAFGLLMVIALENGGKCEALAIGHAELGQAFARGLGAGPRGWSRVQGEVPEMRRANGDTVRIETGTNAENGVSFLHAYLTRGAH